MIRALIAAGLTLPVSGCAADLDGAKAFNERCLTCHTLSEVGKRLAVLPPAECAPHFERFLATHHTSDGAQRAAIIAYLDRQLCKNR